MQDKIITLTTGEVAKLLNVCRATIINWCNDGRIKVSQNKITRYRKITVDEVKRIANIEGIDITLTLEALCLEK